MKKLILFWLLGWFHMAFAHSTTGYKGLMTAPEPTTCISGVFSKSGSAEWSQYTLKITNNCGKNIDFQNANFTFNNNINMTSSFWGQFYPLSYPDNRLEITSQSSGTGFISSFSLHFPEQSWANTLLKDKESIVINYGASGSHLPSVLKVYVSGGPPVMNGQIELTNLTTKPVKVTQAYAIVNIILNGQVVNTAQVAWGTKLLISNLQPGTYQLQAKSVTDSDLNTYEGTVTPATVTIAENQQVNVAISYQQILNQGSIRVKTPALPIELTGYTNYPVINLKRADTGATLSKMIAWNATSTLTDLANNTNYQISTPNISYQGKTCVGTFAPDSLMSNGTTPPTTQLNYSCSTVNQVSVNVVVSGMPCDATSTTVTFQPADGTSPVTKVISVSSGNGTGSVTLADGVVYNVSAVPVAGYVPTFSLQPLMAKLNVTENVVFQVVP